MAVFPQLHLRPDTSVFPFQAWPVDWRAIDVFTDQYLDGDTCLLIICGGAAGLTTSFSSSGRLLKYLSIDWPVNRPVCLRFPNPSLSWLPPHSHWDSEHQFRGAGSQSAVPSASSQSLQALLRVPGQVVRIPLWRQCVWGLQGMFLSPAPPAAALDIPGGSRPLWSPVEDLDSGPHPEALGLNFCYCSSIDITFCPTPNSEMNQYWYPSGGINTIWLICIMTSCTMSSIRNRQFCLQLSTTETSRLMSLSVMIWCSLMTSSTKVEYRVFKVFFFIF